MFSSFNMAGLFLIQSLFDLYIFIVLMRIVLQWIHADFHNPIFDMIAKLTNPPLRPLQRIVPLLHGVDAAAIILLVSLEIIKLLLLVWLQIGAIPAFSGLLVLSFAELLNQLINIFFYAILAFAILSWLTPLSHSPLIEILYRITDPLIRPMRRIIPPIGGVDISPVPVLIGLKLLTMLIVHPLAQIGATLALGAKITQ